MSANALVSIICRVHTVFVFAISVQLFDTGANLGGEIFTLMGGSYEFTAVWKLSESINLEKNVQRLKALEELKTPRWSVNWHIKASWNNDESRQKWHGCYLPETC